MTQQENIVNNSAENVAAKNSRPKKADFNFASMELSINEMLKAGLHFGHRSARWNPKMQPYIFAVRNNIHIIDLEKSIVLFKSALEFVENISKNGGKILFVGTKPQVKKILQEIAEAVNMPYVNNRWLGGTFTNFNQIKKRLKYLNDQEARLARGELEKYTKYEQLQFKKEIAKMNEKMGGIKKMESIPQAVFVTDVKENELAVSEAQELKVPVIGIIDTNVDPDSIAYPIPANDDALSSLRYVLGMVAKSILNGKTSATSSEAAVPHKKLKKENV